MSGQLIKKGKEAVTFFVKKVTKKTFALRRRRLGRLGKPLVNQGRPEMAQLTTLRGKKLLFFKKEALSFTLLWLRDSARPELRQSAPR
jgi:hypothetical protein